MRQFFLRDSELKTVIGAAIGTYFGLLSWKTGGWNLSTWQMLLWGAIALTIIIVSEKQNARRARVVM